MSSIIIHLYDPGDFDIRDFPMGGWEAYWKIPVYMEINENPWAGWIPESQKPNYKNLPSLDHLVLIPLFGFWSFANWIRKYLEGIEKVRLDLFYTPTPTEIILEHGIAPSTRVRYEYDTLRVPEHLRVPVGTTVEIEDLYGTIQELLPRVETLLRANVWPEVIEEPGWQRVRDEYAKLDATWTEFQARGGFPSQETEE